MRLNHRRALTSTATVIALAVLAPAQSTLASSAGSPGTWSPAGSTSHERASFQALTLQNGRVLVAGGFDGAKTLRTADLFDPSTGTWQPTGMMTTPRGGYSATLLPSGKVLVAGGFGARNLFLRSAELYDPATGIWTKTGNMTVGRQQMGSTLLPDGTVLVAGGNTGRSCGPDFCATTLASAEVYNPATGTWKKVGSMTSPRAFFEPVVLNGGTVLAVGGRIEVGNDEYSAIAYADVYHPSTKSWTATGSMATPRMGASVTLLPSGDVLAAGGATGLYGYSTVTVASAELYDPATGLWAPTGSMNAARERHVAFLLGTGKVLVAGGDDYSDCCATALASSEVFDPGTGAWTATGSMSSPRFLHAGALLHDGTVLVVGGYTDFAGTITSSAEVYTP